MSARRRRIPAVVKLRVLQRTAGRCWYCGRVLNVTGQQSNHIDHVLPVSKGGSNDPDNLVASCASCNTMKGDKTLAEYRAHCGGDLFWFERREGGWV